MAAAGMTVALLGAQERIAREAREDTMKWPLFTWILAGGVFSMFWFLYLSLRPDEKPWRPVSQYIERHLRHGRRAGTLAKP